MQNHESTDAGVKLDRGKLKAVVQYICHTCPAAELGNVKLHKILYFADMLTFSATGSPLTGVDYLKQAFGPTARHLSWAIKELEAGGLLRVDVRQVHGFSKKDYVSLAAPKPGALTNSEIALLDEVSSFVRGVTAREISELSHHEAWHAAQIGEVIPYFTVMGWAPEEVTDQDVEVGTRAAQSARSTLLELRRAG